MKCIWEYILEHLIEIITLVVAFVGTFAFLRLDRKIKKHEVEEIKEKELAKKCALVKVVKNEYDRTTRERLLTVKNVGKCQARNVNFRLKEGQDSRISLDHGGLVPYEYLNPGDSFIVVLNNYNDIKKVEVVSEWGDDDKIGKKYTQQVAGVGKVSVSMDGDWS